jgi:lauroyl/myristoyl acyltransferase
VAEPSPGERPPAPPPPASPADASGPPGAASATNPEGRLAQTALGRRLRSRPSERFRREERREFRYQLSVACAVASSWFVWLLPRPLRYWLSDRFGDLFFRLSRTYRENVADNLATAMGADPSSPEVKAAVRRVFRLSARNFADLLLIPRLRRETILASSRLVEGDWSYLDEPLARGQGVVLITAHVGAFDYLRQALWMRGYKVTPVTGRTAARFIFDAVTYLRASHGASIVEATPSGIRQVIHALRRGECAAFVSDYDFFQNGRPVTFFGRPTTLPPGAIRIARDTGAAVVGAFARRTPSGYALSLLEPFVVGKTADLDGDVERGLERVVALLERAIGQTPDQWVVFQRVWPSAPADPVRVFPVGSPLESDLLERVGAVLPRPRGGP